MAIRPVWLLLTVYAGFCITRKTFNTLLNSDDVEFLDRKTLSKLKTTSLQKVLISRGANYGIAAVEKSDLIHSIVFSGGIRKGELPNLLSAEYDMSDTHFESESHFIDDVFNSKDKVWLIQTQSNEHQSSRFLKDSEWEKVKSALKPIGIQTGILYCSHVTDLCNQIKRKLLILSTPTTNKADLQLNFSTDSSSIIQFVRSSLKNKLIVLNGENDIDTWLNFDPKSKIQNNVRMMLILPPSADPPLFYLTLSASLSNDISFGVFHTGNIPKQFDQSSDDSLAIAKYFILTPEFTVDYDKLNRQHVSYQNMHFILRTLQPQMTDVFFASLVIISLCILFDIAFNDSSATWLAIKSISIFLMVWWPLAAYKHYPPLASIIAQFSIAWQHIAITDPVLAIKYDYWFLYSNLVEMVTFITSITFIVSITFLTFINIALYVLYKYAIDKRNISNNVNSNRTAYSDAIITVNSHVNRGVDSRPNVDRSVDSRPNVDRDVDSRPNVDRIVNDEVDGHHELFGHRDAELRLRFEQAFESVQRLLNEQVFKGVIYLQNVVDHVSKLPEWQYKIDGSETPEGMIFCSECAICMDNFNEKDHIRGLDCGHNFHTNCVQNLINSRHLICPMCRRNICPR